jgi:hypothetical protein
MIKYKLICKNCDMLFDSWFATSQEYEKLKKKRLLSCHICNSKNVEKTLMAPKLINKLDSSIIEKNILEFKKINKKIKDYQKFIKKNFANVGKNFAHEARLIHYNEKKNKGIYGTASNKELKELKEEGVEIEMIPWIKDDKN